MKNEKIPPIIIGGYDPGILNSTPRKTLRRLREGRQYKDLSTICMIPTRGVITARVVETWFNIMTPMNNRFLRMWIPKREVGNAYDQGIELIINHPMLREFKYLLTLEEDNIPPPDGLLKLLESICPCKVPCKEHFVQVAGLYFTKGVAGQPMIYGDPKGIMSFQPQLPQPERLQECNGTGMGFTLFHLGLFKDETIAKTIQKPWFQTVQDYNPMIGARQGTQDLYFMGNIRRLGYRIASDNRVKVGHYDVDTDTVW